MTRLVATLLTVSALCLCMAQTQVQAQQAAVAASTVQMATRLDVQVLTPNILVDYNGGGRLECTSEFRVEANVNSVRMYVSATDLYFDKDPTGTTVKPIPLDEGEGVRIEPQGDVSSDSGSFTASFAGSDEHIDGAPAKKTEEITFTCSGDFCFNHNVFVTTTWNQQDPNKPAGRYRAKVKLTCILGESSN
jgi:hypothetical protein